jgi:hypothetical protein
MQRRRYVVLCVTTVLSAAVSLLTSGSQAALVNWPWTSSFASNLAAGFVGALIVVWLIESAAEQEAQNERYRQRRVAFKSLKLALLKHFQLLLFMRMAGGSPLPPKPQRLDDLFDAEYYEGVAMLDLAKPAPTVLPGQTRNWLTLCLTEMRDYRANVQAAIDKYALFLDASELEWLERSAGSPLIDMLMAYPGGDFLGSADDVRAHVQSFLSVCEAFNNVRADDALTCDSVTPWRHINLGPLLGSARRSTKPKPAKKGP